MSYQDPYSQYPQQGGYAQGNPYGQSQSQEGYPPPNPYALSQPQRGYVQPDPYAQPQPQGGYAVPNAYASPNPYAQPQPQGIYGPSGQYGYQAPAPATQYVSVWPRFGAILIDTVIIWIVGYIIGFIIGVMIAASNQTPSTALFDVLGIIIALGYFVVMEATLGRTVGKMALGLKVVREDGSPISWNESLIRNLLRVVDEFPYFIPYLVGAIIIWNSPKCQRLGDKVAKTVVVRTR